MIVSCRVLKIMLVSKVTLSWGREVKDMSRYSHHAVLKVVSKVLEAWLPHPFSVSSA